MKNIVKFENVQKQFGNQKVLEDINLCVNKGDVFGYLGPNGAGKTTSIRMILGIVKPSSGNVTIDGISSEKDYARKNIGFCLDDEGLYLELTARENLEFFDRIYNSSKNRKDRIDDLLCLMKLENDSNRPVAEFSKGMKRRLGLARALINKPELIILDEPTNGLDPDGQLLIKQIIKDVSKESTVFFSSHNLNDVEELCNKVAIIKRKMLFYSDVLDLDCKETVNIIFDIKDTPKTKYMKLINNALNYEIKNDRLCIEVNELEKEKIINTAFLEKLSLISVNSNVKRLEKIYFDVMKEGKE